MKNIIGNKQKRYYRKAVFRYYRAGFVLCLILMALVYCATTFKTTVASPNALESTISNPVVKVLAEEDKYTKRGYKYCYDPIICIRDVGEEMGFKNSDITTMVKIAKCESGFKANAKNPTSTATGIFQIIIGTWDGNKCLGERWDYEDNIKCGWQIYKLRGTQPWISSQGCWGI
jgi:hypothetical protein